MKKLIFGSIFIGIMIIVGAPFANGLVMEWAAKKACTDINNLYSDLGSGLGVEIMDYERSFSSSRITWKINFGELEVIYGTPDIVVVDQAEHGYAGVVSNSTLTENKWFTDFVAQKLDGKNPLDITTKYNLLGNVASTINLDAFSFTEGKEQIDVKPGTLVIACGKGLSSFSSEGSWEGVDVSDALKIDRIAFSSNMEKRSAYIWQGNGFVKIKHCTATPDKEQVELSNLVCHYKMDFEEEDNTMSVGFDYGFDRFAFDEKKFDDAYIHIGINHMDAQGYENLMTLYAQMINSAMGSISDAKRDPDQVQAAMQQQMMTNGFQLVTAVEKILKRGLKIQVSDLKATLPEGDIKGAVTLRLDKDMTMAQFIPIISQPKLALEVFSLQSDLRLPADLVGDNPALLSPVHPGMQTGLFTVEGPQVVHKAETKNGTLFLNGKEVILN